MRRPLHLGSGAVNRLVESVDHPLRVLRCRKAIASPPPRLRHDRRPEDGAASGLAGGPQPCPPAGLGRYWWRRDDAVPPVRWCRTVSAPGLLPEGGLDAGRVPPIARIRHVDTMLGLATLAAQRA